MARLYAFTQNQQQRLRYLIKQDLNDGTRGHVKLVDIGEALAYSAGYTSSNEQRAAPAEPVHYRHALFCERLQQLGYIGYAGFNLDDFLEKVK